MLDTKIIGGTVIDGTGSAGFRADIGIEGGRIAAIGKVDEEARETIDASGRVVAPGFVDSHTHYDAQVFWDPTLSPSCYHGVTTVAGGFCGFSIAPITPESAPYLQRMLSRVEGMPLATLQQAVPWNWSSFGEFLARIEGKAGLNCGFFAGHSAIRRAVMGPRAVGELATAEDLEAMKALLDASLSEGALGLSTTVSATHNDYEGQPVPSRWASREEHLALASVVAKHEGTGLEMLPDLDFPEGIAELLADYSVAGQRAVNWNILMLNGKADAWDVASRQLAVSDLARSKGGEVIALIAPVTPGVFKSLHNGVTFDAFPGMWREIFKLPVPERMQTLRDPDARRRLAADLESMPETAALKTMSRFELHKVVSVKCAANETYVGRKVGEIAAERGVAPIDALFDIALADDLETIFQPDLGGEDAASWDQRRRLYADDRTLVGASDAGAHLDILDSFSFSTTVLARAVREQGIMSLEAAVHEMTLRPATYFGLIERGAIREGLARRSGGVRSRNSRPRPDIPAARCAGRRRLPALCRCDRYRPCTGQRRRDCPERDPYRQAARQGIAFGDGHANHAYQGAAESGRMTEAEPPSTIPAQFAATVAVQGQCDAVAMVAETVTYAELERRSAELARALLAAGAGKGARVALLAPDGIFWVTAFLAALRIGALVTCCSTLCTPKELAHMVRNSDVQFFLGARRFLGHDYGEKLAAAFPDVAQGKPGALRVESAPFLRSVWLDDASGIDWAQSLESLLARAGDVPAKLLAAVEAQVTPSDEAVIVYTSGSTSLPKAVIHTQWNVSRHPPELARLFLIKPDDRMLPMLPAFWLGGMAMALQVLSQGACLVYPASPDHKVLLETMQKLRVNRVNGWGDGLTRLRALASERGIDVDKIVGLGPFRDARGELIPQQFQSGMLGMSETFAPHSAEPLDYRMPEDKPYCCGRPVNGYERRIVDPETGAEMPVGEIGELQLRGGALISGMYKRRREEVFTPDGFYPTGDLCRIDADDYLYFIARRNDMIKTRAANVSRLEVEAALNALPEVATSVVTGLPDEEFGQIVAAAVLPAPGAAPTEEGLRKALREEISSYKVPRRIVFIASEDEIPRTATGKIKLHELGELIESRG